MKPSLVVLLVLSLAGNAVLAVLASRAGSVSKPAAGVVAAMQATTAVASAAVRPAAAVEPVNWQTLKPDANLHTLVGNLRAAGFPPAMIRAMTVQLVNERLSETEADHLPFWKQSGDNPEYATAQMKLSSQRRDLLKELLGPDARLSLALDPAYRERRYGQLADDKIDQIENMSRDYNELRMKLYAQRKPGDTQSIMPTQYAIEQEQHAELANILSPTELEQYEMRSSTSASRVASNLKGVDVNETEYAALYGAQKVFDAVDPLRTTGRATGETMAQRYAAQDQLNEQVHTVLTDDRFYDYLKTSDQNYAQAARFTANYPAITPAMTYDLTRIEREYQIAMMSGQPANGGPSPASRGAQMTAARTDYQQKINTLLGAELATAYDQRNRMTGAPGAVVRIGPGGP